MRMKFALLAIAVGLIACSCSPPARGSTDQSDGYQVELAAVRTAQVNDLFIEQVRVLKADIQAIAVAIVSTEIKAGVSNLPASGVYRTGRSRTMQIPLLVPFDHGPPGLSA